MPRSLVASCLAVVLAACATPSYYGNEDSPYFEVPRDSRLVLSQSLTIPPGVGVFLQYGQVQRFADVDKYRPYCKFQLYSYSEVPRTVAPDEFAVTRAQQENDVSSIGAPLFTGLMLAQFGMGGLRGGAPLLIFSTHMYLQSDKQPDVYRLTCAQWSYPENGRHVTIAEMRRTLGDVMTLSLPGP